MLYMKKKFLVIDNLVSRHWARKFVHCLVVCFRGKPIHCFLKQKQKNPPALFVNEVQLKSNKFMNVEIFKYKVQLNCSYSNRDLSLVEIVTTTAGMSQGEK